MKLWLYNQTVKKPKESRGGRRKGAGRKPSAVATARLNLFVLPSVALKIKERGMSAYVNRLVEADC